MPRLTPSTAAKIDEVLKDATSGDNPKLPPYWFHVADKDSVLYSGQAGSYPDGRPVDDKTVVSLYSMTKFLTSVSSPRHSDRWRTQGVTCRCRSRCVRGGQGGGRGVLIRRQPDASPPQPLKLSSLLYHRSPSSSLLIVVSSRLKPQPQM